MSDTVDQTTPTATGDGARARLPPNQALLPERRWPVVGESAPRPDDAPWTVSVAGLVATPMTLDLETLRGRYPAVAPVLDIHCVTRWSKFDMRFEGVRLADLLAEAGPLPATRFVSFVARSARGHSTSLPLADALDLDAIIAFTANGAPLAQEHGGPVRMVVPGRYFYKSVKWLERIDLLAEDRLGYWEGETGYHNRADPWAEERYIASGLSPVKLKKALQARDLSGQDLLSLEADTIDLTGLAARGALLRNARFRQARLSGADFTNANLSNAHLQGADLSGAVFRGADVEGADFRGADLRGADFTGASLFGCTFTDEPGAAEAWGPAVLDATTVVEAHQLERLSEAQAGFLETLLVHTGASQ